MRMSTSLVPVAIVILVFFTLGTGVQEPIADSNHELISNASASISAATVFWVQSNEFAISVQTFIKVRAAKQQLIVTEANKTIDNQENGRITQNIRESMGDRICLSGCKCLGKVGLQPPQHLVTAMVTLHS